MTVALQIRDVPEEVRDVIAEQARSSGQSVQAYLLAMVQREARMLAKASAFDRTSEFRVDLVDPSSAVRIIREGRDEGFARDRSSPG